MSKASQANLFSELRTVAQLASRTVSRRTGLLGGLSLSSLVAACGGGTASTSSKTLGYVISGADAGDEAGYSVSFAGDVNKDGVADLLIGEPAADPNSKNIAGETYLLLGGQLANLGAANGSAADGRINPSNLNGTTGYILNRIDLSDQSGWSVSSAGDVNKDGHDDLLIGAHHAKPNGKSQAGQTYLVFGDELASLDSDNNGVIDITSAALDGTTGYIFNGIDANDQSSLSISSAGDVNKDGHDDLLIGAPNGRGQYGTVGETYLIFGDELGALDNNSDGIINLSDLAGFNGTAGYVIKGISEFGGAKVFGASGRSVSSAGDVDGDGHFDILIGAPNSNTNGLQSGMTYLLFGSQLETLDSADDTTDGSIDLTAAALNGTRGYVFEGISVGNNSGWSVSSAGDINGDKVNDLLIGAYYADPNGKTNAGETYLLLGGTSNLQSFDAQDGSTDGVLNLIA